MKATEATADQMLWAVCGNPTIQSSGDAASDSDIQYVVSNLVDFFA
jgi:hypothetical protein